jgi:DNA-binding CsgD family transcriptional regulator
MSANQNRETWTYPKMLRYTVPGISKDPSVQGDCCLWTGHKYLRYYQKKYSFWCLAKTLEEPKPAPHLQCSHLCGNERCIRQSHLKWETARENTARQMIHGTRHTGERHFASKLTDKQREEILASKKSRSELAKIYQVSYSTIRNVQRLAIIRNINRKSYYKRVNEPLTQEEIRSRWRNVQDHIKRSHNNGCWLWQKAKTKCGYGRINVKSRCMRIHIVSAMIHLNDTKPIPAGYVVCHRCNVKSCCNPQHLYIGTRKENSEDAIRNGHAGLSFSRNQARRILSLKGKYPVSQIAKQEGVSPHTIRRLWSGITYRTLL